jgi:NADH:ubiquinone oxidoreductase subunit 6 (subunit J)
MQSEMTFAILAAIAILSSGMMISRRRALYGFLYFTLTLLAVAGIFLQLHAPLLFIAQFVVIACVLVGIIVFAVEMSKLDISIALEKNHLPPAARVIAAVAIVVQILVVVLQRRLLPGERLTALLPIAPLNTPPSVGELISFFFKYDVLPVVLILFVLGITAVEITSLFQKRT